MIRSDDDNPRAVTELSDVSQADWDQYFLCASAALERRISHTGQISPPEVARTVAAALPRLLGSWLLDRLESLGWLARTAILPCDLLESEACPPDLCGKQLEVVRLAVFGLPGQGRPDFKHREAIYQMLCAQIARDASDQVRLSRAATRALSHPDVCRDPVLAAMVRSFISEREVALHTEHKIEHPEPEDESQLRKPFDGTGEVTFPTRPQLLHAFMNLQKEFEVHLAQYNEAAAHYALDKMQELLRRFPVHIEQEQVGKHEQEFADFQQRCLVFREQINDLAKQAAQAARDGEQKTASWLLRRLRAIHALTPVLLSAERFEKLRQEIERCGEEHEHRAAVRELITRERAVAVEIKRAGGAIYRFHKLAREGQPGSEEYKRAETAYREAVSQVRAQDTEWLTGLLLELETYIEDLNDPKGQAQVQLDRFIGTVRGALTQLRREIRAIQTERAAASLKPEQARPDEPA
ncbi:MAG: hypothetical protein ABIG44_07800 [Planctomycetota bacterium]